MNQKIKKHGQWTKNEPKTWKINKQHKKWTNKFNKNIKNESKNKPKTWTKNKKMNPNVKREPKKWKMNQKIIKNVDFMVVVYLSINYSPLMKPLETKPNKRNLYSMVIFAN